MTSAVSQLVYMPNFRAIGQSVWEKNGNRQKDRKKHRQTDLNFIKIDQYSPPSYSGRLWGIKKDRFTEDDRFIFQFYYTITI